MSSSRADRRRPMRRLADLLPSVATQLGLDDELVLSRQMSAWEHIVAEHVPAAAGASALLAVEPPALVVSASSAIVAQELRLRSSDLLTAFANSPSGTRLLELRTVIRPPTGGSGGRNGASGRTG